MSDERLIAIRVLVVLAALAWIVTAFLLFWAVRFLRQAEPDTFSSRANVDVARVTFFLAPILATVALCLTWSAP